MTTTAFYAGSFDPPTNGHMDVITRALRIADKLVIGIGVHHQKTPFLDANTRIQLLQQEAERVSGEAGGEVIVTTFDGLVVDAAQAAGATYMVRGLRNGTDYEYEAQMNGMNRTMAPGLETVYLAALPEVSFISSTLVRQIATMGGDITPFVPKSVARRIKETIASG